MHQVVVGNYLKGNTVHLLESVRVIEKDIEYRFAGIFLELEKEASR